MPASAIHPTACIDPSARLGEGVAVGPFAVIAADTVVGDGVQIGPHAVLHPGTRLGARCRVHAHAVLGDWPQDFKFNGAPSFVEIGEDTVLREGVTIHRGTDEGSSTRIGARCYLMANSHVAHNGTLGNDVILANNVLLAGWVTVGDRTFLSGNVVVHQFTRIGRLVIMSGGSGVSKDVPPFCSVRALTANEVTGLNVIGMRRAGFSSEERLAVKRAFTLLYRSGLNVSQAVDRMKQEAAGGPAAEFTAFIESSKRGLCAWSGRAREGDEERLA